MGDVRLEAMLRATERFINKRLRVNKPYQSLIATDEFEAFKNMFAKAIRKQYKTVASELSKSHLVALSTDQLVEQFVMTNMPAITEYVDRASVVSYLQYCFVEGVRAQYGRLGLKTTATKFSFSYDSVFSFDLVNQFYIDALEDEASYLLHKSSIDETTRQHLIDLIKKSKLDSNATIDEIATSIRSNDELNFIRDSRAYTIANTETSRAMGQGNYAAMKENGVETKMWVTAGGHPCETCSANEDQGFIPIGDAFESGDMYEPAHPNDECYTEAGEIDLDGIDIWSGQ